MFHFVENVLFLSHLELLFFNFIELNAVSDINPNTVSFMLFCVCEYLIRLYFKFIYIQNDIIGFSMTLFILVLWNIYKKFPCSTIFLFYSKCSVQIDSHEQHIFYFLFFCVDFMTYSTQYNWFTTFFIYISHEKHTRTDIMTIMLHMKHIQFDMFSSSS